MKHDEPMDLEIDFRSSFCWVPRRISRHRQVNLLRLQGQRLSDLGLQGCCETQPGREPPKKKDGRDTSHSKIKWETVFPKFDDFFGGYLGFVESLSPTTTTFKCESCLMLNFEVIHWLRQLGLLGAHHSPTNSALATWRSWRIPRFRSG